MEDEALADNWNLFGVNETGATGIHTDGKIPDRVKKDEFKETGARGERYIRIIKHQGVRVETIAVNGTLSKEGSYIRVKGNFI